MLRLVKKIQVAYRFCPDHHPDPNAALAKIYLPIYLQPKDISPVLSQTLTGV
jgi:hypothetical protein